MTDLIVSCVAISLHINITPKTDFWNSLPLPLLSQVHAAQRSSFWRNGNHGGFESGVWMKLSNWTVDLLGEVFFKKSLDKRIEIM